MVLLFLFLHEKVCFGYPLQMLSEALLICTHIICFHQYTLEKSTWFVSDSSASLQDGEMGMGEEF